MLLPHMLKPLFSFYLALGSEEATKGMLLGYCCKWISLAAVCTVRIMLTARSLLYFPGWSSCTTLFALAGTECSTAVGAAVGSGLFQPQYGARTSMVMSEMSLGLLWAGCRCAEESSSRAGYGVVQDEHPAPLCTCSRTLRVCGWQGMGPMGCGHRG